LPVFDFASQGLLFAARVRGSRDFDQKKFSGKGELRINMDKRKMKSYRDRLLERREGLFKQVNEAELSSRERDLEATQDPADMAANAYTKELLISMSANDRRLLEHIDEALARVEAGVYGDCVNCGEPVAEKRLEAVPWARYCLKCQDLQERGLLNNEEE
jgi:DnaK suppressor protein